MAIGNESSVDAAASSKSKRWIPFGAMDLASNCLIRPFPLTYTSNICFSAFSFRYVHICLFLVTSICHSRALPSAFHLQLKMCHMEIVFGSLFFTAGQIFKRQYNNLGEIATLCSIAMRTCVQCANRFQCYVNRWIPTKTNEQGRRSRCNCAPCKTNRKEVTNRAHVSLIPCRCHCCCFAVF